MDIFIAIIFTINGERGFVDGLSPRPAPNIEICEQRKQYMTEYFTNVNPFPPKLQNWEIVCGTVEQIKGKLSAKDV